MTSLAGYPMRVWLALAARWRDAAERRRCIAGPGTRILPGGHIVNPRDTRGAIAIGASTWIAGQLLVFPHAGRIAIGDFCYIGEGTRVWSAAQVAIGHRVFLAHGVNVHDNDAHSTSAQERHRHFRELVARGRASFVEDLQSRAVTIEDDAWIGFNSTVLKGTRLGRGAIVGACSVVTRDVAPYTIVAGNPAVVIGEARP